MKIFLYLRNTKNWNKIKLNNLYDNKNNYHFCKTYRFINNVKLWNKFIDPDYFNFREKLKKEMMGLWKIPYVTQSDNFLKKLNDDDIIVPVDDDDFFHPELEDFLLEYAKDNEYGHWGTLVHTSFMNNRFSIWENNKKKLGSSKIEICTNCYFFKLKVLKKLNHKQVVELLSTHHNSLFKAKEMNLKIMNKENCVMSVYNRHPASHSILRHLSSGNHFKNIFNTNKNQVPKQWHWAKEGIDKITNLISNVKINENIKYEYFGEKIDYLNEIVFL
jgi:hypothetical protein